MNERRLQPGDKVNDRYYILDVIHKGFFSTYGASPYSRDEGFLDKNYSGAIYRARALNLPDTPQCVLKEIIIPRHPLEERGKHLERCISHFTRQVAILRAMNHPAIPHVFNDFVSGHGAYLVMEYINGKDLETILNNSDEDLPVEQIVDWAIRICDALSYLHRNRPPFIFRHLQPSHVMLDHQECIKLVDFGLGFWFRYVPIPTGHPVNEPYQPIEQVEQRGHALTGLANYKRPPDPTYDIYSLGVTLNHLLTRRPPEEFPTVQFLRTRAAVPSALVDIVMRAMEHRPSDRFQSAAEMKEALLAVGKTL